MFSCLNARKESRTYATLLLQVWCHQELFFGIRKLADAHFWMQPTELWHFMNQ